MHLIENVFEFLCIECSLIYPLITLIKHCGFQKPIICMHLIINDRGFLFVKCSFIYHLDSTNKQKLVVKASF